MVWVFSRFLCRSHRCSCIVLEGQSVQRLVEIVCSLPKPRTDPKSSLNLSYLVPVTYASKRHILGDCNHVLVERQYSKQR